MPDPVATPVAGADSAESTELTMEDLLEYIDIHAQELINIVSVIDGLIGDYDAASKEAQEFSTVREMVLSVAENLGNLSTSDSAAAMAMAEEV